MSLFKNVLPFLVKRLLNESDNAVKKDIDADFFFAFLFSSANCDPGERGLLLYLEAVSFFGKNLWYAALIYRCLH